MSDKKDNSRYSKEEFKTLKKIKTWMGLNLKPGHLAIWNKIFDYGGDPKADYTCWASHSTLIKNTHLARNTFYKYLKDLLDLELIIQVGTKKITDRTVLFGQNIAVYKVCEPSETLLLDLEKRTKILAEIKISKFDLEPYEAESENEGSIKFDTAGSIKFDTAGSINFDTQTNKENESREVIINNTNTNVLVLAKPVGSPENFEDDSTESKYKDIHMPASKAFLNLATRMSMNLLTFVPKEDSIVKEENSHKSSWIARRDYVETCKRAFHLAYICEQVELPRQTLETLISKAVQDKNSSIEVRNSKFMIQVVEKIKEKRLLTSRA